MKVRRGATGTLFLNGEEVPTFELTGDSVKDLAAAREFLAKQSYGARLHVRHVGADVRFSLHSSSYSTQH